MTDQELKEALTMLVNCFLSGYWDPNLLVETTGETLTEALYVLAEILPGMTPEAVGRAVRESEDGHSVEEIGRLWRSMDMMNDPELEETGAELLDMMLDNLNLSDEIDLNPSLHYRD